MKLEGKSAWSVSDLVNAANFLDATPDELMNDAFMNELGMKKHQDRQGVPVGAGTPRYPVRPEAGNNGTASAGVARPRPFVAMVPPVGKGTFGQWAASRSSCLWTPEIPVGRGPCGFWWVV